MIEFATPGSAVRHVSAAKYIKKVKTTGSTMFDIPFWWKNGVKSHSSSHTINQMSTSFRNSSAIRLMKMDCTQVIAASYLKMIKPLDIHVVLSQVCIVAPHHDS